MKRLILITGLLVALSGLIRSVDAQTTSIVGYGSDSAERIHLIDLETATLISSFNTVVALQGLAIDPTGTTLYGSDQNGLLYSIDIATETTTLIGDTGLGGIEAMDFNFNGTELWVTDFDNFPTVSIYSVNTSDASATLVQTLDSSALGGVIRAMTADTTKDVWIANDSFPMMEFQSVDTDVSVDNVTLIGGLDDDIDPFNFTEPRIRGMDRAVNDVLYGLSNEGGAYIINQEPSVPNGGSLDETTTPRLTPVDPANPGNITIVDGTGLPIPWLALAISTADSSGPGNDPKNAVGEIEIDKIQGQRVGKELSIETYNTDPELLNLWNSLFGVDPETSPDETVTLQGPNKTITWEAGTLEMGGSMRLKVKTDKNDPTVKNVKIKKTGKNESLTLFVSGTGGVNPNLADGGWHEVEVEKMDNVTVRFDGYTITGFLKELKVKLNEDGTVKKFKLKIKGVTSAPDVKKGSVSSVVIDVPQTVVTAIAGADYEEEVKDKPEVLSGHTEAEFEREYCAAIEGIDISSLMDGNNDQLEEREGPCIIEDVVVPAP